MLITLWPIDMSSQSEPEHKRILKIFNLLWKLSINGSKLKENGCICKISLWLLI